MHTVRIEAGGHVTHTHKLTRLWLTSAPTQGVNTVRIEASGYACMGLIFFVHVAWLKLSARF